MTFLDFVDRHTIFVFFLVAFLVLVADNAFGNWCKTRSVAARAAEEEADE